MLDILLAAILLAFGIFIVYLSIEGGVKDPKLMLILFLGIVAIISGAWIIIEKITLALILKKLAGLVLAGIGLFLVIGFPDISDYQRFEMSKAGILIGLIVLFFGLYLLFF